MSAAVLARAVPASPSTPLDSFIAQTRTAIFVRTADRLLLIRPDKTMGLNDSAVRILSALYARGAPPADVVLRRLAGELRVPHDRLVRDAEALVDNVRRLLSEDFSPRPGLRFAPYDRAAIRYPTLAEIALTYRCQNRCSFCYAASSCRPDDGPGLPTEQAKRVMRRIFDEGHVPSLSFTGGEATLRSDLCELIAYGKSLGFRMNLITNGVRAGDPAYARRLVEAGLDSAQVSVEAADPSLHDRIVGRPGAHALVVAAVGNFQRLGIHVHTNTTLCTENLDHGPDIVRFAARTLATRTLSMNMLIRTGTALARPDLDVTYSDVARRLPALHETAKAERVHFVWYSPIPYCIFNPVLAGFGAKSCACVDGILSVGPKGEVLPCSSFEGGIGSLLDEGFEAVRARPAARYWRDKRYLPPPCVGCAHADLCGGACPLYWDQAGSFAELPRPGSDDVESWKRWRRERREGGSWGVPSPEGAGA